MRRLLANLFVAALALLVALAAGELFLRVFRPYELGLWESRRDGLVLLRPGLDTALAGADHRVRTNDLGLRDVEHSLAKPAGTLRIVLLGDSFMEALQVPFEESFPNLLASSLEASGGRPVEVVNAGVSGWGTDDQLTWLHTTGLALEPDLVLVAMTLHNDVSDNLALEWHTFEAGRLRERPRPLLSEPQYLELRAKGFLASHFHVYQALARAWRSRGVRDAAQTLDEHVAGLLAFAPPPQIELGWELTEALLDEMERTAEQGGARLAVFLIPLWIQVEPQYLEGFLRRHALPRAALSVGAPQERMARWGESRGVPVFDLLPAFAAANAAEGSRLYLERDGHWSAQGHRLAAEQVAAQLALRGLAP